MSIDNTDDTCSGGDLNSNVRELLFELRSQKTEIHLLKEEIRGSTLSVASEVKKLKTDKSIAWRFQGNRLQFEFNSEVEDNLKQVLWAIENGKKEYAVELINESCEKLKTRNKHIRIADSSEGGWETVKVNQKYTYTYAIFGRCWHFSGHHTGETISMILSKILVGGTN